MRIVPEPKTPPTEPLQLREVEAGTGDARFSLVVVRDGETSTYPLPPSGRVVIGRSASADIRVEHPTVSREHAALHIGARLRVEDLGSANGTRVRDQPLAPSTPVEIYPDDVVDLGALVLVVQYRSLTQRLRRACAPTYFDVRVDEEIERAKGEASFAVAHLVVEGGLNTHAVQLLIASGLHQTDVMTTRAPGRYELLLLDPTADAREARVARIAKLLGDRGVSVRTSFATSAREKAPSGRPRAPATVIAEGPAMARVVRLLERVAESDLSILLLGETGVGKEVCAEMVHAMSSRATHPFVRLNCGAFTESLLDSELFGHVRGAFTGAVADKTGLLEAANGGTVLLDEIGDMPLATQVRLLRVLESKEVTRVGATKPRAIDIRVVAATHRDLPELITSGRFREDLYYRINGISVIVPPLREHPSDIEPLARLFLARFTKGRAPEISAAALAWLKRQDWPGNVRELRNVVERAAALCDGPALLVEHLAHEAPTRRPSESAPANLRDEVRELERERIERALEACGGNQRRAATELGISRGALLRRIAQLGIKARREGS